MQIREADSNDSESIKNLYLQAFDTSEAERVSDLAVNLIDEKSRIKIISLVAIDNVEVIAHTAFSPVFHCSTDEHLGYILAPLAVSPNHQKKRMGSTIVKHGLDAISSLGARVVLVYGDPRYYFRFGFCVDLAKRYSAPYELQFPEGWQAMKMNSLDLPEGCKLKCVHSLNNSKLW